MTAEKASADFTRLINENGFKSTGIETPIGCEVFSREWTKEVEVAFYGKSTDHLAIKVWMQYGISMVWVIRNGRIEDHIRNYSSPKRMMNAIAEIVKCAGYEM